MDDILKLDFKPDTEGDAYILKEPENPVTLIKKRGKVLLYKFDTKKVDIFPSPKKEVVFLTQICDYIIFYPFGQNLSVDLFYILDIASQLGILVRDGQKYSFAHQQYLDYYAEQGMDDFEFDFS